MIVYSLDHMYSENNILTAALKAQDAHRVSQLRFIGEQLGFQFRLLNIELYEHGQALDRHYYSKDEVEMKMLNNSTLKVVNAFDLNGQRASFSTGLNLEDDEILPKPLAETVPTKKEYEGYQGNVRVLVYHLECKLTTLQTAGELELCMYRVDSPRLCSPLPQGIVVLRFSCGMRRKYP